MFVLAGLSCGCSAFGEHEWVRNGFKVGPNYTPPSAPVAGEWIESKDPRTQAPPPRDGNWWEAFQDPYLSTLICQAYQHNPTLRAASARVMEAHAQQRIAFGNIFPQSQKAEGFYPTGNGFGAPSSAALTAFSLSWELDVWGKYRRQLESARAAAEAAEDNYDDTLVTLLADVATNYVQFRVSQQRIKIARENLKTQERLVTLSEQQTKVGTATTLDVSQFRTLYEQTRSSIPAQQIVLGQSNDQLCVLLGVPPHDLEPELGPGPATTSPPLPIVPTSVAASIPSELLSRRPDIKSAERQVAAQVPQIGVAKSDYYPSVSIGTVIGYADLGLQQVTASQGFLGFFTPQFQWKILNYGRIKSNVRLQEAKTDEAIALYQGKVLTAAQQVQTALRGFLLSQDQAEHLAKSAEAAYTATVIEEKLFIDIKADVNRLFTLESSLLQSQDQLAIARGNIALNLINVYRALGGGWEVRTREGYCPAGPMCTAPVTPSVSPKAP
jgi:NodT family efflux transporter outer membrane factor (OMF) lipoprotein